MQKFNHKSWGKNVVKWLKIGKIMQTTFYNYQNLDKNCGTLIKNHEKLLKDGKSLIKMEKKCNKFIKKSWKNTEKLIKIDQKEVVINPPKLGKKKIASQSLYKMANTGQKSQKIIIFINNRKLFLMRNDFPEFLYSVPELIFWQLNGQFLAIFVLSVLSSRLGHDWISTQVHPHSYIYIYSISHP